ncbi:hypothetical protein GCM10025794_00410 [Massilia kyonggiensis]|nr:hypothetical protein [Massilia kyonggiensis]
MNAFPLQNWAPIIKRQHQHRALHGFARLSPDEARALVAYDAHLNGYEGLRTDPRLAYVSFTTASHLDHMDLAFAISTGIDRNAEISPDDPLYVEKKALLDIYTALFGALDQPFSINVGPFGGADYLPKVHREIWLKPSK